MNVWQGVVCRLGWWQTCAMSSAFENAFTARRLCNWEVPKWYPPRPRQRKCPTKIIVDERGYLPPNLRRTGDSPWGYYKGTFQLPNKITRATADEINKSLIGKERWKKFNKKITATKCDKEKKSDEADAPAKPLDMEYVPGDFTPYDRQHVSRDLLLQQKYERDNNIEPHYELNDLYLEKAETQTPILMRKNCSRSAFPVIGNTSNEEVENSFEKMHLSANRNITEKPHERSPSPIIPAFANFELARKMHQENLDHQPLPDCIADMAFRKLQIEGHSHPGLALNVQPIATGVGVKAYKAGPTHCTKAKIFRPKTCGVVPRVYKNVETNHQRPFSSAQPKKMGSMDLAICWDYRPENPAEEPRPPRHIDGSNESAGPAVFTFVKTPRTPEKTQTPGRSTGVFTSTFGELGFFDKDIMRRKTDFMQAARKEKVKCSCGTSPVNFANEGSSRAKSVSRAGSSNRSGKDYKQYQSSPNLSQFQISDHLKENETPKRDHLCRKYGQKHSGESQPGFFRRTARMCHKVAPQPQIEEKEPYKQAFRVGVPKYNAAGTMVTPDSGCSSMSGGSCSNNSNKVLVIPRPRNPYNKKSYDIETLVPPFTSLKGGAGQGGYPEHWRLTSVYQHAYKPIEQRKRPLLQTVYK